MITGDRLEPILLVQTIHLLQDEEDITDQSHQGSENIAMDHTLDHLMGQEAAAEAGVIAGAEVTAGA